ncbi:hemerythrin domain-containing protein [uncultured Methanobacterium sp.]|uniref:hemerythrin domain-containing protein n=1 Tax=uncultured Methanobacterium sp. TaxID=176306 RepID=UPI002AA85094|nr:hemerythrin domain-containing protein [uncultured Methanobacterium sp.]
MSNENPPNVGEDYIRFHKVMTRGLALSIQNVDSFLNSGELETQHRDGFLKYVQTFSSVLNGHHLVEDEKIFPYFMDKLPEVPYQRLISEHNIFKSGLQEINSGLDSLKVENDEMKSLQLLKSGLGKIDQKWHEHIQIENTQLYGRVGSLKIDSEEMMRIQKEFVEFFQEYAGPEYLLGPFVLYNLSPEDRAIAAQGLPEIVTKQLIPIEWKGKWAPMQPFLLE